MTVLNAPFTPEQGLAPLSELLVSLYETPIHQRFTLCQTMPGGVLGQDQ
jgi:hypothetical protein